MTTESRCVIRFRTAAPLEFAEIAAGRQAFLVSYPDDGEAVVGDALVIREIDPFTGQRTGAELRADVTVICEATSAHVVGFRLRAPDAPSLYRRALKVYGHGAQLGQTIEECAELIVAINHYRRGRLGLEHIAEETADIENMCAQMRVLVGDAAVDAVKRSKLERFEKRLDAAEAPEAAR